MSRESWFIVLIDKILKFFKESPEEKYEAYGHSEEWVLNVLEKKAGLPAGDLECPKVDWPFPRRLIQVQRSLQMFVDQTITRYDIFSKSRGRKRMGTLKIASPPKIIDGRTPPRSPSDPLMRGDYCYHGIIFP